MTRGLESADWIGWAGVGLLGLAGAGTVLFATPWGIGVGYDSYFYLSAAENLLTGAGLGRMSAEGQFLPLVHFPPLYPLVLAGLSWLSGLEVVLAARWLAAALLAINLAGLALLVGRAVGGAGWGLAAGVVALASPGILGRHLWAMSEPLFFALLLALFACVATALRAADRRWLALSAVVASLAYLTRYAGLAASAAALLALITLRHGALRARLKDGALFLVIHALLIGPWLWRNVRVRGSPTNRSLVFHPIPAERLREGGRSVADWLPLPSIAPELRLLLVLGGAALVGFLALRSLLRSRRAGETDGSDSVLWLGGLFGVAYAGLLTIALLFFDASTRLDERILSPLYWVLILVSVVAIGRAARSARTAAVTGVAGLLLLIPLAAESAGSVVRARAEGLGFHSRQWRQSETLRVVSALPQDTLIYSNEAIPVMVLTGRAVHAVPERLDPVQAAERPDFRIQLGRMRAQLRQEDGVLVLFHPQALRIELPSLTHLTQGLNPELLLADGAVYRFEE